MSFLIKSLQEQEFEMYFEMTDAALEKLGARRMIADAYPGYPCRVSLQDAAIGEEVILLPYQHHKTTSPYQASGPVFVRKSAKTANLQINEIPKMLHHRLLSLRGYTRNGMMKQAKVIEGKILEQKIIHIFEDDEIDYIHIHNAKPGCFNCVVERSQANNH
jgi:hypothetical protein